MMYNPWVIPEAPTWIFSGDSLEKNRAIKNGVCAVFDLMVLETVPY